jgi:lipopolysaccharide biosynthesis protein
LYVARRLRVVGYETVLKIHSKKSKHREDGSSWFNGMLDGLLPDSEAVRGILDLLKNKDTGLIGPEQHLVSLKRHMGSNKLILEDLLKKAYGLKAAKTVTSHPEKYPYFGGTMFWARIDTLDPLLDLQLMPDDFQSEQGQIDGTAAHAVERFISCSAKLSHKNLYVVGKAGVKPVPDEYDQKYDFAP